MALTDRVLRDVSSRALARYETQAELMGRTGLSNLYLDEVEFSLHCWDRLCRGGVSIDLIHDDKNEGFVGAWRSADTPCG